MGKLVDDLANKLVSKAGALGAKGIEDLADEARAALPTGDAEWEKVIREEGLRDLDKLVENKDELGRMAGDQLVAFLAAIGIGNTAKATGIYVGAKPGSAWAEAGAEIEDSGNKTEQAKRDQDLIVGLAKDIGASAAKALVSLLVMVV